MIKKSELRTIYKEKRIAITQQEQLRYDDLLLIQFQKLSFESISTLLSYWPILKFAEPNTHLFARWLQYLVPSLRVAYPSTNLTDMSMKAVAVDESTEYKVNAYGVAEPVHGSLVYPQDIDVVFVPMLICDKRGYRVGYGKGFYDRYLVLCRKDVIKIGFSYFEPIDEIEDTHPYDVPLNYCITTSQVHEMPEH